MSVRTKFLAVTLAAAAIAGAATSASATTITQTFSHTGSGSFSVSHSFSGFDTSFGTLTSVTLTLTLNEQAYVKLIDLNPPQSYSNATATIPISASATPVYSGAPTLVDALTLSAGPFSGTTSGTVTALNGAVDTDTNSVSPLAADFHFYETPTVLINTVLFGGSGTYTGVGPSDGTFFFGGGYSGTATETLTYDYTPRRVPEPLTLSLFGAGLAGAAALRRRKKQNA